MKKIVLSIVLLVFSFIFIPNVDAANMIQNPNVTVKNCANGESVCSYGNYNEPRIRLAAGTTVSLKVHSADNNQQELFVLYDDNETLTLVINDAANASSSSNVNSTLSYYASNWDNVNNLKTKYTDYSVGITTRARTLLSTEYDDFYNMITTKANNVDEIVKYSGGKQYWVIANKSTLQLTEGGSGQSGVVLGIVEVPKYVDQDTISGSSGGTTPGGSTGGESGNSGNSSDGTLNGTNNSNNNSEKEKTGDQIVNVDDTSQGVYLLYIVGSVVLICGIVLITQAYKKVENEVNL